MRTHWVQGLDGEWREEVLPGRVRREPTALRSNRIGRHQDREMRSYHSHASSVRAGDTKTSVKGSINYIARDADFEKKAADLECMLGDANALNSAATEIERTARIKRGRTAEKVLQKVTLELPNNLTKAQRAEVAETLIASWAERGHIAVAAVHGNQVVQPHVHLLVTARPVALTDTGWVVDRTPGNTALRDRKALMEERHRTAGIINQVMDRDGVEGPRFFGGRDAQMEQPGIVGRQPQRRVPERAWLEGQRSVAPVLIHEAHVHQRAAREARAAARNQVAADRASRVSAGVEMSLESLEPTAEPVQPLEQRPRKGAERPFRLATESQRRTILKMAHGVGVPLRNGELDRLDGNDLFGVFKRAQKAPKADRHSVVQEALEAAEERAALHAQLAVVEDRRQQAELRTMQAEQMFGETVQIAEALIEAQAERDALVQAAEQAVRVLPPEAIKLIIETQEVGPPVIMPPLPVSPVKGMPKQLTAATQELWENAFAAGSQTTKNLLDYAQDNLSKAAAWNRAAGKNEGIAETLQKVQEVCEQADWIPAGLWNLNQQKQVTEAKAAQAKAEADAREAREAAKTANESSNARAVRKARLELTTATTTITALDAEVKRLRPIAEDPAKTIAAAQGEALQARDQAVAAQQAQNRAEQQRDDALRAKATAEETVRKRPIETVIRTQPVEVGYVDQDKQPWPTATSAAREFETAYRTEIQKHAATRSALATLTERWTKEAEPAIAAKRALEARTAGPAGFMPKDRGRDR